MDIIRMISILRYTHWRTYILPTNYTNFLANDVQPFSYYIQHLQHPSTLLWKTQQCASITTKSRFHNSPTFLQNLSRCNNAREPLTKTLYSAHPQEKGEPHKALNLVKGHTSDKEQMENKGADTVTNCIKRDETTKCCKEAFPHAKQTPGWSP